ncbi:MAG TPA: class I lanthipeptide [Thermoanaerobaculia bacterium]
MKKSLKKLGLSRETLRSLNPANLSEAAGGAVTDATCVGQNTCPHTNCDTCPIRSCVDTTCPPCVP